MKYYRDNEGDIWQANHDKDPNKDEFDAYLYDSAYNEWVPYKFREAYSPYILISEEEAFIEIL